MFFLLVTAVLSILPPVASAAVVELAEQAGKYELGPHLEIMQDPRGTLTAEDAFSPALSEAFRPSGAAVPNFGYTDSAYLVRFRLKNALPPGGKSEWFLELAYPALDSITLVVQDAQGKVVRKEAGDSLPFRSRDIESRNYVFRLPLRPGEEKTVALRIASTSSVQVPLTLWSPDAYYDHAQKMQFGFGVFYGFLILMILYNGAAYLLVRDVNHLYYIFQAFAFGMVQFTTHGFAYQFLWPGLPSVADRSVPFSISLLCVSMTLFSFSFLNLREFLPGLHRWQGLVLAPAILVTIFTLAGPARPAMLASAYCVPPYVVLNVALGGFILMKGYRPARYFLIAWSGLFAGAFVLAMSRFGIAPRNFWTEFGTQIGFAAEIFILSIAITDRINMLKQQKEAAELRLHEERQRIARDLHDVAGSALTDMLLRIRNKPESRGLTAFLESRMEQVVELMHDTIYLLNQPDDFARELERHMEGQAEIMKSLGAFAVRYSFEPAGRRIGTAASYHVYRIFLEWTTNIVKHARPTAMVIRWMNGEDEVRLFIAHDGGAFSWNGLSAEGPGHGLRNIAARSTAVKGRIRVIGLAGRVTLFLLRIPCPPEAAAHGTPSRRA